MVMAQMEGAPLSAPLSSGEPRSPSITHLPLTHVLSIRPCPAPSPRLLTHVLWGTQQMFAKRINHGKQPTRKEILHKRLSKAIGHPKPARQETINCNKKGRPQPGSPSSGQRACVKVYKEPCGVQTLFPGSAGLSSPAPARPQPSRAASLPRGSRAVLEVPAFLMSVSPPINHGSVEHIPETGKGDLLTPHLHPSTLSIYRSYSQSPRSGSEVKVTPCVPLYLLPLSAEGRKLQGDKGKAQRVLAIFKME